MTRLDPLPHENLGQGGDLEDRFSPAASGAPRLGVGTSRYEGERPGIFAAASMALRNWTTRQWTAAIAATLGVGVVIGLSTVLIPNGIFGREIDSVAWNYPVWITVSVLSGMLFATYVQPSSERSSRMAQAEVPASAAGAPAGTSMGAIAGAPAGTSAGTSMVSIGSDDVGRESRMGMVGVVLGWFAVGCPVCNKIALIALGYSGALRWFAPVQPLLAVAAVLLSGVALLYRLRGQVWCPAPITPPPASTTHAVDTWSGQPADR